MTQCPRCLKHTGGVGVHTCTPTDWARKLELKASNMEKEREGVRAALLKAGACYQSLGTTLASLNLIMDKLAKKLGDEPDG